MDSLALIEIFKDNVPVPKIFVDIGGGWPEAVYLYIATMKTIESKGEAFKMPASQWEKQARLKTGKLNALAEKFMDSGFVHCETIRGRKHYRATSVLFDTLVGSSGEINASAPAPAKEEGPTALKEFTSAYFEFYEARVGVKPPYGAVDGKFMKSITKYICDQCKELGTLEKTPEQIAVDSWKMILSRWDWLPDFLQNQLKVQQIFSNLTNIIPHVRNGKETKRIDKSPANGVGTTGKIKDRWEG